MLHVNTVALLCCAMLISDAWSSQTAIGFTTTIPVSDNATSLDVLLDQAGSTLGYSLLRLSQFWNLADRNRPVRGSGDVLSIAVALPDGSAAPLTDAKGLPFAFNASTDDVDTVATGINVSAAGRSASLFLTIIRLQNVSSAQDASFSTFFGANFVTSEADPVIMAMVEAFNASYGSALDRAALLQQFGIESVSVTQVILSNSTANNKDDDSGLPTGVIVAIVGGVVAVAMLALAYFARKRKMADDEAFTAKYGSPVRDGQSPLLKHFRTIDEHGKPQKSIQQKEF
jgi:hypothetical protein